MSTNVDKLRPLCSAFLLFFSTYTHPLLLNSFENNRFVSYSFSHGSNCEFVRVFTFKNGAKWVCSPVPVAKDLVSASVRNCNWTTTLRPSVFCRSILIKKESKAVVHSNTMVLTVSLHTAVFWWVNVRTNSHWALTWLFSPFRNVGYMVPDYYRSLAFHFVIITPQSSNLWTPALWVLYRTHFTNSSSTISHFLAPDVESLSFSFVCVNYGGICT